MVLTTSRRRHERIYLGGTWLTPSDPQTTDVINPTTEQPFASVPVASAAEANEAARVASAALPGWSSTPIVERAAALDRIAIGIEQRIDEIASVVSQEVGTPIERSREWQAQQPVTVTRLYAQLARRYDLESPIGNSVIVRDPVGVVACITPWNFPLHQAMLKVAPALAAGCTIVLKPSSLAPLTAFILAEVIDGAGLPAGVFNLVSGSGPTIGEALAASEHIDMISLTGSTQAGKRVAAIASQTMKRFTLELGGKSASLVLDDADLETSVADSVHNCYANAGQTCAAWTRLLVPRTLLGQAETIAVETAEGYRLGDPLDPATTMGPLVSAEQRDIVRDFIKKGQDEGAKLLTGGQDQPSSLPSGYFVKPTVFSNVEPDMVIAREEIFGPVLAIEPCDSTDDAVRVANASIFGLSGAVWSADEMRALGVARRLQTGQVFVNGAAFNYQAPFGGVKQSGIGREFGQFGLEEYLELKSIQLPESAHR